MRFHIICVSNGNKKIASFEDETDRDVSLSNFEDVFPDCEFEPEDD